MKKWVHIISFDPASERSEVVATCVLEDGKVSFEGDKEFIAARLDHPFFSPEAGGAVSPEDGEPFLRALGVEFRSPQFFASDVQEGDEVEGYEGVDWKDAEEASDAA